MAMTMDLQNEQHQFSQVSTDTRDCELTEITVLSDWQAARLRARLQMYAALRMHAGSHHG
jgi:hypothetical protein